MRTCARLWTAPGCALWPPCVPGWVTEPVIQGSPRVYDAEHLVFMDIASPDTAVNLERDPRIEINSIDFLRHRGYRFRGTAEFREPRDVCYQWLNKRLLEIIGPGYPANRAILVDVDRGLPVLSPSRSVTAGRPLRPTNRTRRKHRSRNRPVRCCAARGFVGAAGRGLPEGRHERTACGVAATAPAASMRSVAALS